MWDKGEIMKKFLLLPGHGSLFVAGTLFALFLVACGDDDDFSPVAKNRGYDYAYTTAKGLSETPCNEMREGREAVIGRDKDRYECRFDRADSVYIWVGYDDTLTAEGREFHRAESSSSLLYSSSSYSSSSSLRQSSANLSSSIYSSSSESSSSYSSSSSNSSSSSGVSSSSFSSSSFSIFPTSSSSSSAKSSSSSVVSSASKDNFFNSDVTYGILKDSRDGQVYKTVEINGTTWMAENLNFAGNSDWPLPKNYSYCYGGIAANCALYGRLYDRAAAMNSTTCGYGKSCSLYDGLNRGVCPDGWHIPSEEEVDDLMDFTLGNRKTLRSVDGWVDREVGANESGFSLVGSGVRADKNYVNQGRFAALWYYSTGVVQNYLVFSGVEDKMYLTENSKETVYISVRCVKGAGAEPASSGSTKSSSSGSSSNSESSSSEEYSSSFDKTVLFNSAVSYGEMTDGRDGKTYRTLNIAGHTWMAENLNFADSSKLPILEGNNRCYDDDPGECAAFGRLYSREAALNDSRCTCYNGTCPSMSGNVQGICPSGWHIPSKSEAEQLANLNGNQASSLNSSYGWATDRRGNNSTGMSFVGTGVYQRQTGYVGFKGKGNYTNLWVYDASTPNENWYLMDLGKGTTGNGIIAVENEAGYDPFYTVRCVKD